ncbi:MAG: hypothetical protein WAR41_15925, partial [Azonexus sp.]
PPLPFPNRTVKQMSANDSELPLAKVGQRQTPNAYPLQFKLKGFLRYAVERSKLAVSNCLFSVGLWLRCS